MGQLIHGGDWAGFEQEYGRTPLDFSANVSPLGLPDSVKQAIITALDSAGRYPDPLCRTLCEKLGLRHRLPSEYILCGNGAADLIYRLVLAAKPKTALVTAPSFAEYEEALCLTGCHVRHFYLHPENDFAVTEDILEQITPQLDMLFLCEPNNPTGKTTERMLLQRILEQCAQTGTLLIADECFNEFLDDPDTHTLQGELTKFPNLLILKAFTKWYAMAGVRLGYALCGNSSLLDKMRQSGQPWSVSALAQAAGCAALDETEYSKRLKELIRQERPQMMNGLKRLGCRVYPGEANYLLFYHVDTQLVPKLRKKGILLRDCSNYAGLGPGWYRTAVRTEKENQAFLSEMKMVLL